MGRDRGRKAEAGASGPSDVPKKMIRHPGLRRGGGYVLLKHQKRPVSLLLRTARYNVSASWRRNHAANLATRVSVLRCGAHSAHMPVVRVKPHGAIKRPDAMSSLTRGCGAIATPMPATAASSK